MSWTAAQVSKELDKINASIPKELKTPYEIVVKDKVIADLHKEALDLAIKRSANEPVVLQKLMAIRDQKPFDNETMIVPNEKKARELDKYLGDKIEDAIKEGRLPKREDIFKIKETGDRMKEALITKKKEEGPIKITT